MPLTPALALRSKIGPLLIIFMSLLTACGGGNGAGEVVAGATYAVTYDGNAADGGTVPVDTNAYQTGQVATISGNTGGLVKTGHTFSGWNTQSDGNGATYAQAQTLVVGAGDVTLYAKWSVNPTYTVAYDGNGSTGGTVPVDSTHYETGQLVTVLANTGGLVRTGHSFAGWNTQTDGNGTTYTQNATFGMGAADMALYAKWTPNPTYTVTYDGNGNTGGSVPTDTTHYETAQTVTVLGNTGNLVKDGHSFADWNTNADGSGVTYAANAMFSMGAANVTLYGTWAACTSVWYWDGDGDTFGSSTGSTVSCTQPNGFVARAMDCDDTRASVNPGAPEICGDAIDNDCDGVVDEVGCL